VLEVDLKHTPTILIVFKSKELFKKMINSIIQIHFKIKVCWMCAGGLTQAHFKHASTTLIVFIKKQFAKKLYSKFKKNQSLIEVCLKWTSSTL